MQYQGGDLFTSWNTAVQFNGDPSVHDGVYWLDERPQLSPLNSVNPGAQLVALPLLHNAGIYGFAGYDTYTSSLTASAELDQVMVMTISSPAMNPTLIYTARRATDAPNVMGVGGYGFVAHGSEPIANVAFNGLIGTGPTTACSLDTNLMAQGLIWCVGRYGGSHSGPPAFGWDTYVVGLATNG